MTESNPWKLFTIIIVGGVALIAAANFIMVQHGHMAELTAKVEKSERAIKELSATNQVQTKVILDILERQRRRLSNETRISKR